MTALIFVLLVVLGGLGSVLRLFLAQWVGKLPWGVLIANVVASLIGAAAYLVNLRFNVPELTLIVTMGFCGGLSTFSSFAAQTVEYFKAKQVWRGVFNTVLNFLLPSTAALGGAFLTYVLLK